MLGLAVPSLPFLAAHMLTLGRRSHLHQPVDSYVGERVAYTPSHVGHVAKNCAFDLLLNQEIIHSHWILAEIFWRLTVPAVI